MPSFIDFVTAASIHDGNYLANTLRLKLKENPAPEELLKWFHSQKRVADGAMFDGISLEDCNKLLLHKEGLLEYMDMVSIQQGY